ncbi:MAG TPA: hypothetical protein VK752_08170 [Bryobacteraceae bacterium]|jgi:hypothetical protein|nr:hypothetical protein [Bryobacteraceae bacterium]
MIKDENPAAGDKQALAETALKLAQMIAIIASGCWVIYTYLSFQRNANELTLKQQELSTKQAEFALNSQRATEETTLQQTKVSLDQARLQLDIQNSQRALRERELNYDIEAKKLDNDLRKQKQASEDLTLRQRSMSRFSTDFALRIKNLPDGRIELTFDPGLKVTSEVGLQMTVIRADIFHGRVVEKMPRSDNKNVSQGSEGARSDGKTVASPSDVTSDSTRAIRICPPPRRSGSTCNGGAVAWSKVGTFGSIYPPGVAALAPNAAAHLQYTLADPEPFERYGPGAGPWKPGERIPIELKFLLYASAEDFVGVSVELLINDAKSDEDVCWYELHGRVADLLASTH